MYFQSVKSKQQLFVSIKYFCKLLPILMFLFSMQVTAKQADYTNPSHDDVEQELTRLRSEGAAYYESGIAQKKALAVFEKALGLKGADAIDSYNIGVIYRKLNKISDAKKYLLQAIKEDPNLAQPHYVLGLILIVEDDVDAALSSFISASKLRPNEASSFYQLSHIYRKLGKKQDALQAIVETLRLDPYHTGAMYQLYLYHQQSGDKDKAAQVFKEFSRLKRALGLTRKEINPDESVLSKPINSDVSSLKRPFQANESNPHFTLSHMTRGENLMKFAVADVNEDKLQDIVVVDENGVIGIWLNNANAGFKLHISTLVISDVIDIQLVKFRRSAPYSILLNAKTGVYLIPLKDRNPKPVSAKGKRKSGKENMDKSIALAFDKTQLLSEKSFRYIQSADIDHDGDTDIIGDGFSTVWLNRGDSKFDEIHDYLKMGKSSPVDNLAFPLLGSDLRNRIAVDFIAVSADHSKIILQDDMGGKYGVLEERLTQYKEFYWAGRADMDNDGWIDIVSLTASGLSIDYNLGNLHFNGKTISASIPDVKDVTIADYNSDGFKDILYSLEGGGLQVWMNRGDYQFVQSDILFSSKVFQQLHAIKYTSKNLLDIVAFIEGDGIVILENLTENERANLITLKLDGIRSAPDGRYTQVEIRYGGYYAKYEAQGDILHVPLGAARYAELLRISWPNGFVENKFSIEPETPWYFAESERISGSCPSLYAWDGERYNYITDAFISGPMGVPVGHGKYFPVGDDEYVKIPGEFLKRDVNGEYKLSIVEELREVTYIDQLQLLAVDYPASYYMFPNEYLMPPEQPEFKLHISAEGKPATYAIDHHGNDVTELIGKVDYRYPHDFSRLDYTGFSEEQGIELHLTKQELQSNHLRLFLTGWFYYFDSTSLISVSQQPEVNFIWPQIQVYRKGEWSFFKRIGIPSGKEKTIVVDLGGQLPNDVEKIRIWTNVELYWDRILVDTAPVPEKNLVEVNELVISETRLRLHGFSELVRPVGTMPMPDRFNYHKTSYRSFWNPLKGKYTRYGEVDELVANVDGEFAVFSAGDELAITFNGSSLPKLKKGYKRDFLIYLNGFVKDGDKYTAHAGAVDPMPFAGLRTYPYTKKERDASGINEGKYQQYLNDYQSRDPLIFTGLSFPASINIGQQ